MTNPSTNSINQKQMNRRQWWRTKCWAFILLALTRALAHDFLPPLGFDFLTTINPQTWYHYQYSREYSQPEPPTEDVRHDSVSNPSDCASIGDRPANAPVFDEHGEVQTESRHSCSSFSSHLTSSFAPSPRRATGSDDRRPHWGWSHGFELSRGEDTSSQHCSVDTDRVCDDTFSVDEESFHERFFFENSPGRTSTEKSADSEQPSLLEVEFDGYQQENDNVSAEAKRHASFLPTFDWEDTDGSSTWDPFAS